MFASSSVHTHPLSLPNCHTPIPTHTYVLEIPSCTSYVHTLQQRPSASYSRHSHISRYTSPSHTSTIPDTPHTHFFHPLRTHTHTHHAHVYTITCLISFHDHSAQARQTATPHTELIPLPGILVSPPHSKAGETPPNPTCQNSKPTLLDQS